jgi:ABC-type lipoprotein release transport system permease subunit
VHDEIVLMTQALDGSIGNDIYRVAAIFKPISPTFDRSGVVMAMTDFEVLMALSDGFHELVVKTQEPNSVALTAKALERDLENLSGAAPLDALGGAIEVRTWKTLVPMVGEMLALSGAMMFMVGGVLVGLAALGMVNTMLMAMHERVHELGILRALGLRAGAVCLLVLLEAFFLGITATVLGAGLGVLVTLYFSKTGIDFSEALPEGYDWGGMVFEPVMQVSLDTSIIIPAGLLMVGLTLLAVVLPARRVLKRAPVEMLA